MQSPAYKVWSIPNIAHPCLDPWCLPKWLEPTVLYLYTVQTAMEPASLPCPRYSCTWDSAGTSWGGRFGTKPVNPTGQVATIPPMHETDRLPSPLHWYPGHKGRVVRPKYHLSQQLPQRQSRLKNCLRRIVPSHSLMDRSRVFWWTRNQKLSGTVWISDGDL